MGLSLLGAWMDAGYCAEGTGEGRCLRARVERCQVILIAKGTVRVKNKLKVGVGVSMHLYAAPSWFGITMVINVRSMMLCRRFSTPSLDPNHR